MDMRYLVRIEFKEKEYSLKPIAPIVEQVKTLREALSFESIIDDTVKSASVTDKVTNRIVKILK